MKAAGGDFFVPRPLQEMAIQLVTSPSWPRHVKHCAPLCANVATLSPAQSPGISTLTLYRIPCPAGCIYRAVFGMKPWRKKRRKTGFSSVPGLIGFPRSRRHTISAPSSVLSTSRTSSVVLPSLRTDCQSFPQSQRASLKRDTFSVFDDS